MLVGKPSYQEVIRAVRELIFDVHAVPCFEVNTTLPDKSAMDYLTKDNLSIQKSEDNIKVTWYYELINLLRQKGFSPLLSVDYAPNESISTMFSVDKGIMNGKDMVTVYRENYFSKNTIEKVFVDFFDTYLAPIESYSDTETFYRYLTAVQTKALTLWTAYYLVDKQRMQYASNAYLKKKNEEPEASCDEPVVNSEQQVSTGVGDTFEVMEELKDEGKGFEGFSALWGDKYSYLSKLQLYLRGKFEAVTGDYGLRDNALISSDTHLYKDWRPYAHVDTFALSEFTKDFLLSGGDHEKPQQY